MNELIKVSYDNDRATILGRDLHEFLEVDSNYTTWLKRMCEYGFIEGVDFIPFLEESTGGRPSQDHQLTIDMAKEICMLQRSQKGRLARQYFIELEKAWNTPEMVMSRALKMADKQIKQLQRANAELELSVNNRVVQPKESYYDVIDRTEDPVAISRIARDYGMTKDSFNELLEQKGVQFLLGGVWTLYNNYAALGYTRKKIHKWTKQDGQENRTINQYWTRKGRTFLYELLKCDGILPLIERDSKPYVSCISARA